jgi:hypothetical protein
MQTVLASAATIAAPSIVPAADSDLDTLWLEHERLILAAQSVYRQTDAAYESLPAWAKWGSEDINHLGERCVRETGWPELAVLPDLPEEESVTKLIRPSPMDIKKHFELIASVSGDRSGARATYRASMRRLVERIHEQRRLRREAGIYDLENVTDEISDRR